MVTKIDPKLRSGASNTDQKEEEKIFVSGKSFSVNEDEEMFARGQEEVILPKKFYVRDRPEDKQRD